jgi:hypothetical protein
MTILTAGRSAVLTLAYSLALAACATTGGPGNGPTEVSRYHLGQPLPAGSVTVEPMAGGGGAGLEFQMYADAVAGELSRIGFAPAPSGTSSQYVAAVSFVRTSRGTIRTPPKFSIGIGGGGGGGYGGGVGLGGGISTGFGSKTRDLLMSELFVQIRRRSDGTVVWEGRAQRPGMSGQPDAQPAVTATRLADALFRGFPGESGITTTVR